MDERMTMPQPQVDNLRAASKEQLVDEVIAMRQFVALLLLKVNDMLAAYKLPDALETRLVTVERSAERSAMILGNVTSMQRLVERISELERKADSANRTK